MTPRKCRGGAACQAGRRPGKPAKCKQQTLRERHSTRLAEVGVSQLAHLVGIPQKVDPSLRRCGRQDRWARSWKKNNRFACCQQHSEHAAHPSSPEQTTGGSTGQEGGPALARHAPGGSHTAPRSVGGRQRRQEQ